MVMVHVVYLARVQYGDNGVSMGGILREVSTLKNCYILAGSKDLLNLYMSTV
jgi:hypothetical protein